MQTQTTNAPANAVLLGSPYRPADYEIVTHVEDLQETFKFKVENRYDHFVPTDEVVQRDDRELRVFRYSQHTYIAE